MNDLVNFFDKPTDPLSFSAIKISLASPEKIRSWSFGEVKKPETINYRTFKPERDGLFCAKIFGPVRDYECICGKYKRMKHRGIVCDKCGVEVISSKVRRERLGHINLAVPVAHIWFLKSLPSRIGSILDIALKDVERILYSESYVVLDPGNEELTGLTVGQVIGEEEYDALLQEHGNGAFRVGVGAEAIQELLGGLRIEDLADDLRKALVDATSEAARKKLQKRLKVVEAFNNTDAKPEWMMLSVIPVLPPDLRPLVPLDGGRFATSDLNDLYRRVINRNNRLLRLIELNAPEIIIRNEKRMLQEAVDALFDNGRRGKVFTGPNKRALRSLSDMLKGKQGRFRQNLLGKRVDYSGRSVIVVGPQLKLHQCGLPKKMAIELFKPFIYNKLEEHGIVSTIKSAKKLVEKERPEVWDILEEVTKEHPVLLNRAPTLHRLGIQAFEPVLIEGKAIQLHPLVCFAFNADFDGDQMAVHVPLSVEAQMEARVLMMSTNNILSPASGSPVIVPTQDIVLGIYYMTKEDVEARGAGKIFATVEEVRAAYDHDGVDLQAPIQVRVNGVRTETTVGRVLLSEILPEELPFSVINRMMGKKELAALVDETFRVAGPKKTVLLADALRATGYRYSTKAGLSISIGDMVVPEGKQALLDAAYDEVKKIKEQYSEGLLTEGERYNKVVDIWAKVTENIAEEMFSNIAKDSKTNHKGVDIEVPSDNSIFMMADSGARGSAQQIRQLAGMRGLMAKPSGEIIETPITANFREGLSVLEYFTSTHGARKGLADTALKTASSGYLTRRLVDVAQDATISELDCGTGSGIQMTALREGSEVKQTVGDRTLGRTLQEDVVNHDTNELIASKGDVVTEEIAAKMDDCGVEIVNIRSVLTCQTRKGICARCYGRDLATGHLINVGEAIGVIAAQSIGEPGTQLTMRTFHFGGTVTHKVEKNTLETNFSGIVKFERIKQVTNRDGQTVVLSRNGEIKIVDKDTDQVRDTYPITYGSVLVVKEDQLVEAGDSLAEWDPFAMSILAEVKGAIKYFDMKEGQSIEERTDEATFLTRKVIIETRGTDLKPALEIVDGTGSTVVLDGKREARYSLPVGATVFIDNGKEVEPGDILAKIPRETAKTKDITGGLPRVAELFEARKPKDIAIMSDRDGAVTFGADSKGKRKVIIVGDDNETTEYLIPKGRHVIVTEGDYIRKGEAIVDGSPSPHDILAIMGHLALARFLVDEVQDVYRLQGVKINDKHIEVIVRQMCRRVKILSPGDTRFLPGEQVERFEVDDSNVQIKASGGQEATYEPLLLGITKASLSTDSFISAASFQETTKVLTEAAINSKVDHLRGLKENVIMGRLIPAGTGSMHYRHLESRLRDAGPSKPNPEVAEATNG
ncbi:DNA-directed RNA polymerase subunit beta' [Pseudobacteriovorax antillogorgiicola]|uniref:DNA-directed RNA polymerase subunit beta' n=1 Tax=Pseudobacteriovorax antillogorgiicola TaxID=1513793 RepID=A0A1Y6B3A7_9BACT|nr:DNA-directed RNA polymerase subunit beta' [Pseudobacteriovorax antillogorgiicola]TCS59492.1 DNA-directed RNA polymerase subunit beta' [Pseudobacteriovorax antillogorgiicola]SME87932.1 DNA-directed RNA polymerase subunit beta' [Pseudobacteriovorax antillogorgiicola]